MKTYILLDRSGSMSDQWDDALGGINSYVKKLKGKQKVMLATFDALGFKSKFEVIRDCDKSKWKPVTGEDAFPRGGTPLNDAMAEIILRMLEENEERAVLVVMTDGFENASVKFTHVAVKSLLNRIMNKDWQTVFLGANFDGIKEQASNYGINSTYRGILSQDIGSTYSVLSKKVNDYAAAPKNAGSVELSATMDWSTEEQNSVKK